MKNSSLNFRAELKRIESEKCRRSFWEFRKKINKNIKVGWWQIEIASQLQQFYEDFVAGKKPILIIQAPPQHGKSVQIIDFIAWVIGKNPDLRQIFSSFSDRLGIRANLRLRRILLSENYKSIFPDFRLPSRSDKGYTVNLDLIEFFGKEGYFRNTTVNGSITGESLDIGIIDDPIKGSKEANSKVVRESSWNWFTDDFFTRFSEIAGLLIIGTRWHVDDPIGRLIDSKPSNLKILKYPAIATEDEKNRKKGEVLFPELKSLEFIESRKKVQGIERFEALYQQSPIKEGGSIFNESDFKWFTTPRKYKRIVISWDTAQKANQLADPSCATVWGEHDSGFDLLEVFKERMEYPRLKREAIKLADKYHSDQELYKGHRLLTVLIEDKSSGQSLIQDLRLETNFNIVAILPQGDKIIRASTCSPKVEAGKVFLKTGANWVQDYLEEMITFPNSTNDDQVDSTSQFLNWIAGGTSKITEHFF